MEEFEVGETVRINTPGESHHKRTGMIHGISPSGQLVIDLGDVTWLYWPHEVMKESK